MDKILFDEANWPVLLVKHPEKPVDKELTIEYLKTLETYFRKGEKFSVVFDVTIAKPPNTEHRFMVASWVKSNEELIKKNYAGTAYVMSGAIQKLALMTFLRFLETTAIIGPVKVFSKMDKAMIWANKRVLKK